MEVRPGYKQTEVGAIPEKWEVKPLGKLSEFVTSGSRGWAKHYSDTGPVFVRSQNIRDGRLDFTDQQCVTPPAGSEGNRTRLNRHDLLITITGNSVGNVAWVERDLREAYISQHIGLVRLSEPSLAEYVCLFLSPGSPGNRQIWASQTGQSKPGLNLKNLQDFWVALPSPPERCAIATTLRDVDALLDTLGRLIAKKRDLQQGAMQELLTGAKRLAGFDGDWNVKQLGGVASFHKGRGLAKSDLDPFGLEPCIHYGELFTKYPASIRDVIGRTNNQAGVFRSVANDVLMPTSDVTPNGLGTASCILQNDVILGGDILVIRSDRNLVDGSFLSYVIRLLRAQVMQLVTGTTVYHLYGTDLKQFTFSMPSIEEQNAIVRIIDDMAEDVAALEEESAKVRQLKQGLMHELLTGKTRLVSHEASHA